MSCKNVINGNFCPEKEEEIYWGALKIPSWASHFPPWLGSFSFQVSFSIVNKIVSAGKALRASGEREETLPGRPSQNKRMRFSPRDSLFLDTGMNVCLCALRSKLLSFALHSWSDIWGLQLSFLEDYYCSWKGERCGRCEDALVRSSFNCPCCQQCCLQHPSAVSTLVPHLREAPKILSPKGRPLLRGPIQGMPGFLTSTWGNSEGHCGSWSPLGMALPPDSFYPILLPPSLFHRCWSQRQSFRSICKLIPKVEPLPGKPSLRQKTIIHLWIADWVMLFSCLKCLWDEVQTP